MPNEALRAAMTAAMLTERDLAGRCQVDEKTVARWIAEDGRIPHPRHRYAAAEALGADVEILWPDTIRRNIKTGPDREVIAVYPRRSDAPKAVWRQLITNADTDILFAGYTSYFIWVELPNLRSVLRRKAESGCRVRFLLGDPESEITRRREEMEAVPLTITTRIRITLDELAKMGDIPGVEARFTDKHIGLSVFKFGDEMLMCQHLENFVGHDSPMLHLARCQDGGLYDRYAHHADWLWNGARTAEAAARQSPELGRHIGRSRRNPGEPARDQEVSRVLTRFSFSRASARSMAMCATILACYVVPTMSGSANGI